MRNMTVARLRDHRAVCRAIAGLEVAMEGLSGRDVHGLAEKWRLHQRLQWLRGEKAMVERALDCLTPVERRIVDLLDVTPQKGNCAKLCEELCREPGTVYRWREEALKKVEEVFYDMVPEKQGNKTDDFVAR